MYQLGICTEAGEHDARSSTKHVQLPWLMHLQAFAYQTCAVHIHMLSVHLALFHG